jgi:hypothetical protein
MSEPAVIALAVVVYLLGAVAGGAVGVVVGVFLPVSFGARTRSSGADVVMNTRSSDRITRASSSAPRDAGGNA